MIPTPHLSADLFLLHAPSVFDFRERDDLLFAYLSDSDSVNVTSIYEPLWHKRLNYETKWLSRKQLQDTTCEAIARLVTIEETTGLLTEMIADCGGANLRHC